MLPLQLIKNQKLNCNYSIFSWCQMQQSAFFGENPSNLRGKGKSAKWTGSCVLGPLHLGQEAGSWEANLRARLPPAGRHLQTSASAAQRPATRCRTGRLCSPGTKCTSRRPPSWECRSPARSNPSSFLQTNKDRACWVLRQRTQLHVSYCRQ